MFKKSIGVVLLYLLVGAAVPVAYNLILETSLGLYSGLLQAGLTSAILAFVHLALTGQSGPDTDSEGGPSESVLTDAANLTSVLDGVDAVVFVADVSTYELLYVNRKFVETFGEPEGRTCYGALQIKNSGPCPDCNNSRLDSGEYPSAEVIVRERYNPTVNRWFEVHGRAVRWNGDRRLARLEVATDITRRKEMENALVSQNEISNAIFHGTASGVLVLGRLGEVIRINREGLRILGLSGHLALGKKISDLRPELSIMLKESEKIYNDSVEVSLDSSGQKVPIGYTVSPLLDGHGTEIGKIAVFQDLTEILKKRRQSREEERAEMLRKILTGFSHEVRNPLFAIKSIGQLIEMRTGDDEERILLKALIKEAAWLDCLIDNLLLLVRPGVFKTSKFGLRTFLEGFCSEVEVRALGMEIKNRISAHIEVTSDWETLSSMLLALCSNSAHAGASSVEFTAEEKEHTVLLCIADNGSGLDKNMLAHAFEPFFTTRKSASGLGLTIARKMAEELGGSLTIENDGEKGALAALTLLK